MSEEGTPKVGTANSSRTSRAADISRAIVQLMHRYTGRGPTKARTTVNTNIVAVVLGETMTRGELNLVDLGQREAVLNMRRRYHDAIRAEARELVEAIIGRRVISTMADIDLDADLAVIFFVLEPQPETGLAITADAGDIPSG